MIRVQYQYEPSTYAKLTVAIASVDQMIAQTTRTVAVAARAGYKQAVPSARVANAVTSKYRKAGPVRTIRTGIANKPLGPPVHGRDPGAQSLGFWLDKGTGYGTGKANRLGDGKIRRTDPSQPFMHWGYPVPFVSGQKAQPWVREARAAGDIVGSTLIAELGVRVRHRLGPGL